MKNQNTTVIMTLDDALKLAKILDRVDLNEVAQDDPEAASIAREFIAVARKP
jgi:hypothetical protein